MSNKELNFNYEIVSLFDYYSNLLTDKQKEYFKLYFFENLTLQEIADEFSVSRNAVYDAINKVSSILEDYESKLKLFELGVKFKKHLEDYKNNNLNTEELMNLIDEEF